MITSNSRKGTVYTALCAALLPLCAALTTTAAYAAPESVDELNDLLRGEISAVETYRQALDKVGPQPEATTLKSMMSDHEQNVAELRRDIERLGGTPSTGSGAWGLWAKTVQGTSNVFGDSAALKALKEGEEHGLKEHQEVAADMSVPSDIRTKIKDSYIPKQQAHIESLDRMIDKVS